MVQFLTFTRLCVNSSTWHNTSDVDEIDESERFLGAGWCQSFSLLICSILLLPIVQLPTFLDSGVLYFAIGALALSVGVVRGLLGHRGSRARLNRSFKVARAGFVFGEFHTPTVVRGLYRKNKRDARTRKMAEVMNWSILSAFRYLFVGARIN